MGRFLIRRIGGFLLTLWCVITLAFFMMRSVRGGPFDQERALHPAAKASIEASYHLNWPLWKQYFQYLGPFNLDEYGLSGDRSKVFSGILAFDFGPSLRMRDFTVNEILYQAFPKSAMLGLIALAFALVVGLTAGALAARNQNTFWDHALMSGASLGLALPNFLIASFLIIAFCFVIPIFPPAGWGEWKHLILPGIALGAPFAASISRLYRTSMLEMLQQDFIRAALAKGLSEKQILWRHAVRGALLPLMSYLGLATAGILTGSLVIEKIFAIPGLGTHFVQSALNRDYTLAMGITILYTSLVFALNALVDISYSVLDPRVEIE